MRVRCAISWPPPANASSSSTAGWARRSSSSTSRSRTTTGFPAAATRPSCSTAPTSSRASTRRWSRPAPRSWRPTPSRPAGSSSRSGAWPTTRCEINRKAAEIARKAVGEDRFVAGSIGPTGYLPASDDPTLGQIPFRELVDVFAEQAQGLLEGGADLLIIETAQDILEVKAAVFGAREAFEQAGRTVPIQTSVSLLPNGGKMLLGTDISAVLATLEALKVDVIGLNCSTGPEDMRDAIRFLGEYSPVPVHCIPNAGLPLQGPDGETIFPEQPGPLADALGEFVERYGVSIVGGCCGTTPEHIRAIDGALRAAARRPSAPRRARRTSPR